jgi:hypothetical protein
MWLRFSSPTPHSVRIFLHFSPTVVCLLVALNSEFLSPLISPFLYSAFWKKWEVYREQPTVHSTRDYMLLLQGTSNNGERPFTMFWSTVPEMNRLVPNDILRAPTTSLVCINILLSKLNQSAKW